MVITRADITIQQIEYVRVESIYKELKEIEVFNNACIKDKRKNWKDKALSLSNFFTNKMCELEQSFGV